MFIVLDHVSFSYLAHTPFEISALVDVNCAIDRGESVGIIGRTGCGKSTLTQHFNALLFPDAGKVLIDGSEIRKKSAPLKEVRQKIGLVFQYPEHQIFEETVFGEVSFGPRNMGMGEGELERTVRWALDMVGLDFETLKEKNPFELSGGQMRRVAIASILSMRPQALVLDEPTAGLDPEGKKMIFGKLKTLRDEWGTTLVIVSHSMEDLAQIAQRIIIMDQGKIVLEGPIREIFSQVEKLEWYGVRPPATARIAAEFRKRGYDLDCTVLTPQELAKEIEDKIIQRRKG
ncbi:MAG: energy-coupling factor transporter ATPase [Candidatus Atribacteria bacterium]|nr:energy-coupling factor transporter ATPase [Candidatus Atribacteria bacterium]